MGSRVEQWCDMCGNDGGDLAFKWGKPSEIGHDKYSVGLCEKCCDEITSEIDKRMEYRNKPKHDAVGMVSRLRGYLDGIAKAICEHQGKFCGEDTMIRHIIGKYEAEGKK